MSEAGKGPQVDIAVDPLEGTTLCAKNQPDSICVLAMAERGGLLNAPDVYMQKIAIGSGYPEGTVDLDMSPRENIASLAKAKGVRDQRNHRRDARSSAPWRTCSRSCAPPAAPSS